MIFNYFNQSYSLYVSNNCQLSCLGCNLKSAINLTFTDLKSLIDSGKFFTKFPKEKYYNLYGGDPLTHEGIVLLCHFLAKEHIKIRIWTHLHTSIDVLLRLKPYVFEWCFFSPSCNKKNYQYHVGDYDFQSALDAINELKAEQVQFNLHHPLSQYNVAELPYITDFSIDHNIPLWIHFRKKDFSRSVLADIYYFETHPGIVILPIKNTLLNCCNVPLSTYFPLKWLLFFSLARHKIKHFKKRFI